MGANPVAAELLTAPTRTVSERAESSTDEKLKNLRILVVEDDLDTQELLNTVLQQHGAEVVAVDSCECGG